MAKYPTRFSCVLDARTPEHAARALDCTTREIAAWTYTDGCLASVLDGGARNA